MIEISPIETDDFERLFEISFEMEILSELLPPVAVDLDPE